MNKGIVAALLVVIGAVVYGPSARADYILDLTQVGGNVVATGSGTIDLTGLSYVATSGSSEALIDASEGLIATGANATPDVYNGFSGPTAFGSGSVFAATSSDGDYVGIAGTDGILAVPNGYASGDPLSSSATFDNESLASLGVTPGTYVWTWGEVPDGSFTLNATVAPVPEPGSLALFGSAMMGLLAVGWSRRRRARLKSP